MPRQPVRWRRAPILLALAALVAVCDAVSALVRHPVLGVILALVAGSLMLGSVYVTRWVVPDPIRGFIVRRAIGSALLIGLAFGLLQQGAIYGIGAIGVVLVGIVVMTVWQAFRPDPPQNPAPNL